MSKNHSARDLTGRQFGELTVLHRIGNSPSGASRWLCRCACGEEYRVLGTLLTTGRRTRCSGKSHQKNYAYSDISGQHFGCLTALYPVCRGDRGGSVIWHCRCDCGNETDVSYNSLMYTGLKSCGCQKKAHSQKLHTYLNHVDGTSVEMLCSRKIPTDNTTGFRGVYFVRGKYMAKIVFQKKQYFLGTYDRIEDAAEARREAEKTLFEPVAEHCRLWKQQAKRDPRWAEENPIQIIVTQKEGKLQVEIRPKLPEKEKLP